MKEDASRMTHILTLQATASSASISLHEPLWVECTLSNPGAAPVQLDLGAGAVEAFRISIDAPAHAGVAALRRSAPGFAASGEIAIAPGAAYHQGLLLDDWYRIESPGRYRVAIALQLDGARIEAAPVVVEVLARDAERLGAVCARLAARAAGGGMAPDAVAAAHALAMVADAVAVPFLEQLVTGNSVMRQQAIAGLGRVGDDTARAVLRRLAGHKHPETAALARQALRGDGAETPTD